MSDNPLASPDAELLKRIPPNERGSASMNEVYNAFRYLREHGCHLIPTRGLLCSRKDRAEAFNTAADLKRYAERFAVPNFIVRCFEQTDPFRCIRSPSPAHWIELESIVGERVESVRISNDAGDSFVVFRANTRTPALDLNRDIAGILGLRVSRFFPLPGARCRKSNTPYRYARFLGEADIPYNPINSRLMALLPKKSTGPTAPPVAHPKLGYAERPSTSPEELAKRRLQQRARRAREKADAKEGLGLEAQEALVSGYLAMTGAVRLATYEEKESGTIRAEERPELAKAIAECKAMKATLLVATLSRVGRRRADVLTLIDESGVKVAFADEPHASSLSVGVKAVVAHDEAASVSLRTRAALAVVKAKGVKLGNPNGARALKLHIAANGNGAGCEGATRAADEFATNLRPISARMIDAQMHNTAIAEALNERGVPTRRAGAKWYETSVKNVRARLAI